MTISTLLDGPLRNSPVFDSTRVRPVRRAADELATTAADEFAVAVATLELQQHCSDSIRSGAPLVRVDPAASSTVSRLFSVCEALTAGDRAAATALDAIRAFYQPQLLRSRRILLDDSRLARAVDALDAAATDSNPAAFETLVSRALRLLAAPLLPA